jgi:hypothetical protein
MTTSLRLTLQTLVLVCPLGCGSASSAWRRGSYAFASITITRYACDGDSASTHIHNAPQRVFEANVRITIYDANGAVLTDTFTTAAQAGRVLAPYSAAVPFSVSTTQQGCVRVWEESA